jgi:hypothetical protein
VQKLRPDDHFMILLEGDETPLHIGSLLVLHVPDELRGDAAELLRQHLLERLPHSPLMRTLCRAPLGFDSDVWIAAGDVELDRHVVLERVDRPMTDRDLNAFVETHVMRRLDLSRPPFLIQIIDPVGDGPNGARIAVYVRVHHSVADGVGFQHLLGVLSDDGASSGVRAAVPPYRRCRIRRCSVNRRLCACSPVRRRRNVRTPA